MRPLYELRGERYNAEPVRQSATDRNDLVLELDGKQSAVHIQRLSNHEALLTIDGLQQRAFVAQDGDTLFIHLDGQTHELTAITEFAAAAGADLVVTDVWASMGQEAEQKAREAAFSGYQVNAELMSRAAGDALYMHCLPAHRGEEISAELMDAADTVVWEEAENRLHAQKAIMEFLLLANR